MATTSDVCENAVAGQPVRAGVAVVFAGPRGNVEKYTGQSYTQPATTDVETKYTNRVNHPAYYTT